jgi:gluconolactonase
MRTKVTTPFVRLCLLAAGLLACLTIAPAVARAQETAALYMDLPSMVVEPDAAYPEGPLWHNGRLYYTEMSRDRVMSYDGRTRAVWFQEAGCGPVSVKALSREGDLIVLCHLGAQVVRLSPSGRVVAHYAHDSTGRALRDPNDADADGEGGLYFSDSGIFNPAAPATGRVYHYQPDGTIRLVADGLRYSNGVEFDGRNRRLLVSEHLARRVLAFPVRPDHTLGNAEAFFNLATVFPPRYSTELMGPDGLDMDARGNLFIAEYGAGRILMVSSEGRLLHILPVPMQWVTDMAVTPDGFMFVTGAFDNLTPPFAGRVLRLTLPAQ